MNLTTGLLGRALLWVLTSLGNILLKMSYPSSVQLDYESLSARLGQITLQRSLINEINQQSL